MLPSFHFNSDKHKLIISATLTSPPRLKWRKECRHCIGQYCVNTRHTLTTDVGMDIEYTWIL